MVGRLAFWDGLFTDFWDFLASGILGALSCLSVAIFTRSWMKTQSSSDRVSPQNLGIYWLSGVLFFVFRASCESCWNWTELEAKFRLFNYCCCQALPLKEFHCPQSVAPARSASQPLWEEHLPLLLAVNIWVVWGRGLSWARGLIKLWAKKLQAKELTALRLGIAVLKALVFSY